MRTNKYSDTPKMKVVDRIILGADAVIELPSGDEVTVADLQKLHDIEATAAQIDTAAIV